MKANILEIFRSIQGEGKYAGVLQTFIRFFECHMHCVWCDTPDSIGDGKKEYRLLTLDELYREIEHDLKGCHSISLTGGEPLLQVDFIKEFITLLKNKVEIDKSILKLALNGSSQRSKIKIYLETSGVLYQALEKIIESVDIIAMDFKLPSSTRCRAFFKEHEEFLRIAGKKDVFVKAVVSGETEQDDIVTMIDIIRRVNPDTLLVLQPNYFEIKNGAVKRCHEYYGLCTRSLQNVRVMPQMHKMMGLR